MLTMSAVFSLMFWVDGANIYRSDLSGRGQAVIVNASLGSLVAPNKLAFDSTTQRLYWLDAAASDTFQQLFVVSCRSVHMSSRNISN